MRTTRRSGRDRTRMRAAAWALGLGLVLAACGEGGYGSSAAPEAPAPAPAPAEAPTSVDGTVVTVTEDAELGTILTDATGRTLYLFTSDSPGVSTCVDGCLAAWPALLTEGEPVAEGDADAALLGTLTRDDGAVQVTYNDWPLYVFASDMSAGDVTGQGVNDVWFVVTPSGTAGEAVASDEGADGGMGGYGSAPSDAGPDETPADSGYGY